MEFPLTSLDMRRYLSKKSKCENTSYDLYGVVNHMGKIDEGHYYAFVRIEDGRWFRVNDIECIVRWYFFKLASILRCDNMGRLVIY